MGTAVLYHDLGQPNTPHSKILDLYLDEGPGSIVLGTGPVFYPDEYKGQKIMDKMIKAKELGIPVFGVMRHLLNGYELSMDRRLDDEDLRYNVDLDALNAGFIPLLGIPRDILEKRKVIHEAMSKDSEIRVSTEKYELVPSKIRDFLFDGIERATEKARSYGDKIALARVYVSHPEFDKGVDENIESARRRLDKKRSSR